MKKVRDVLRWLAVVGASLTMLVGGAALAQSDATPQGAILLVAKPELQPPFGGTVLLVMPAGDRHYGFILNRPLEYKLGALVPDNEQAKKVVEPVRFGGPVMAENIFVITSAPGAADGKSTLPAFGDLVVSASARFIERTLAEHPNDARYFVGFVAWEPGELGAEIAQGYWAVAKPRAEHIFRSEVGHMWEDLLGQVRTGPELRADAAGPNG